MKLLLAALLSMSLSTKAQMEKFEGVWTSPTSSYFTTIMYNEEKDQFKIINFSFKEDEIIYEKITKVEDDKIFTSLHNESNSYSVNVIYELLNNDQILCVFEGDINRRVAITRMQMDKNYD
jgi:hypothetical protein